MPMTRLAVTERYALKDGEEWWVCGHCGRILGRHLASGVIERKVKEGWEYVYPQPAARLVIRCTCQDPPFENVFLMSK